MNALDFSPLVGARMAQDYCQNGTLLYHSMLRELSMVFECYGFAQKCGWMQFGDEANLAPMYRFGELQSWQNMLYKYMISSSYMIIKNGTVVANSLAGV